MRQQPINYMLIAGGRFLSKIIDVETPQCDFEFSEVSPMILTQDRLPEIEHLISVRYPDLRLDHIPVVIDPQILTHSNFYLQEILRGKGLLKKEGMTGEQQILALRVDGPLDFLPSETKKLFTE